MDTQEQPPASGVRSPSGATATPVAAHHEELLDQKGSDEDTGLQARRASAAAAGPGPSSLGGAANSDRSWDPATLHVQLAGLTCNHNDTILRAEVELQKLAPKEWINDNIIDMALRQLWEEQPEEVRQRCHIFNAFFMTKLVSKHPSSPDEGINYDAVKDWTKDVDIFRKQFVFIPVHGRGHWSLVVACHPGNVLKHKDGNGNTPYWPPGAKEQGGRDEWAFDDGAPLLLHFDSLESGACHATEQTCADVRAYFKAKFANSAAGNGKKATLHQQCLPFDWRKAFAGAGREPPEGPRFSSEEMPAIRMTSRLPTQDNGWDCGPFTLLYAIFLMAANPRYVFCAGRTAADVVAVGLNPEAADPATFMQQDWFSRANAACLRDFLRALICRLLSEIPPEKAAVEAEEKTDSDVEIVESEVETVKTEGAPAAKVERDADPEDLEQKRRIARHVAEAYERKPKKLDECYLSPRKYLDAVRRRAGSEPALPAAAPSAAGAGGGAGPSGAGAGSKVEDKQASYAASSGSIPPSSRAPLRLLSNAANTSPAASAAPRPMDAAARIQHGRLTTGRPPLQIPLAAAAKRLCVSPGGGAGDKLASTVAAAAAPAPGPSERRDEEAGAANEEEEEGVPAAGADKPRRLPPIALGIHVCEYTGDVVEYSHRHHGAVLAAALGGDQPSTADAGGAQASAARRRRGDDGDGAQAKALHDAMELFPVSFGFGTSQYANSGVLQFADKRRPDGRSEEGILDGFTEQLQGAVRGLADAAVEAVRSFEAGLPGRDIKVTPGAGPSAGGAGGAKEKAKASQRGEFKVLLAVPPLLGKAPKEEGDDEEEAEAEPPVQLVHFKGKKRTQASRDQEEKEKGDLLRSRIKQQRACVRELAAKTEVAQAARAAAEADPDVKRFHAATAGEGSVPLVLTLHVALKGAKAERGVVLACPALAKLTRATVRLLILSALSRELVLRPVKPRGVEP